ncbi:helix-turn-helix transcriptional regulator [Haloterrigena sp. SYSU A121-1]|uniref:Helix-turn-helix transcriptional regulator n=1 Tax=Haloterrigena gelatinilytica TaxID=2741724 RepID=A0A8J8KDV1_9EURY|nr:helix-turn-helix transcriptional regulator [Haloterrigena gelatinilytica]NUB89966.1 helix-turn-helix transcriptional regulator [Haloterrigena gelatinilytica]
MCDDLPPVDGSGTGPCLDDFFAVFANYRRRCVLHHLREEQCVSLGAIARQIAAWERAYRAEIDSENLIDRIETELIHMHLPKLREVNLVEYDRQSSIVVYRDPPAIVSALLDLCTDRDIPK